jgi:nitrate/TMAO reductase-like tetraheme cytochrome c subunit
MIVCAISLTALLNGCGSSSRESGGSPAYVAIVDETACAQCHGSSFNSQSGMPIYSEYVKSKHFSNSVGEVVGCQDCHGGGAQHNGVGPIPYPNPDTAGKCFGCHKNAFLGLYNTNKKPSTIQKAHFYNITGASSSVHDAMYVTKNFENGCTACHEPHNPLKGKGDAERKAWAESAHGGVSNPPFADEDFKENASCIRCHTSTGYVNFVNSNWAVPTVTWATAGDKGREVLTCRTCHNNDSFSVRSAGAFTAPYAKPATYPSVGESNLCIACHSGRANESDINTVTNFANASFKNSHYKAGAGVMYLKVGFQNFTTATAPASSTYSYGASYTMYYGSGSTPAGNVSSTHRKLGTTLINGDSHNAAFFVPGTADANGPCVTCHYNTSGVTKRIATGHNQLIDVNAAQQLCIKCHAAEVGINKLSTDTVASAANLEEFLSGQKQYEINAIQIVVDLMLAKNIEYDGAVYPYFFKKGLAHTSANGVKDWTLGTNNQAFGKRVMGAAYNLNLLIRDGGSYAHGRTYARRLIFDTIDFLDDGLINQSAPAYALAHYPVIYQKGVTANAAPTTEDYKYLAGYNRTSGVWNALPYVRP